MTLLLALDFSGTKLAAAMVNAGYREWLGYERRLSPPNANANTLNCDRPECPNTLTEHSNLATTC